MGVLDGRVAIVTGAGRGLGREHALALAEQGARVVVNDLGGGLDGGGDDSAPASQVVAEIARLFGAEATADFSDVADERGAESVVHRALEQYGRLDVVVNNAGILRDRVLVNMSYGDWDDVIRVHLRSTFGVSRAAARHWREQSKDGEAVDARIINTTSPSGLFGNVGQANYSTAKAGIAAFTLTAAAELTRYGVTVNAVSPVARTRMTEALMPAPEEGAFDGMDPGNVSPLVAWLASPASAHVTGRVFALKGGRLSVVEGWHYTRVQDIGRRWTAAEIDDAMTSLLAGDTDSSPAEG